MGFDVYVQNVADVSTAGSYEYGYGRESKRITIEGNEKTRISLIDRDLKSSSSVVFIPEIEKVIYNPPATVIIWSDNTKTVVKCQEEDIYDKQTGFMLCVMKKVFGNKFNDILRKWVFETADNENVRDNTDYSDVVFDEFETYLDSMSNFMGGFFKSIFGENLKNYEVRGEL